MAVPRKKVTRAKRGMRRAHDALKPNVYVECENCGELKRPHHICGSCGFYSGREAVVVKQEDDDYEDDAA